MKVFGWDDLRAVLVRVAPNAEPVITEIDFEYEEVTTRDGGGVVHTTVLRPTGANISIRLVDNA